MRFEGTEIGLLIWLVSPHSATSWTAQEESCHESEQELSMDMSCSSTEWLQCRVLISMSIERRPKSNSLLHTRPCSQLQGKWGGTARISYSTPTILSLSQSSDKDKSPGTMGGLSGSAEASQSSINSTPVSSSIYHRGSPRKDGPQALPWFLQHPSQQATGQARVASLSSHLIGRRALHLF